MKNIVKKLQLPDKDPSAAGSQINVTSKERFALEQSVFEEEEKRRETKFKDDHVEYLRVARKPL